MLNLLYIFLLVFLLPKLVKKICSPAARGRYTYHSRGNFILVLSCFFKINKYISECWPR